MIASDGAKRLAFATVAETASSLALVDYLIDDGWTVLRPSLIRDENRHIWPEVGVAVAKTIAAGDAAQGIALCWTGQGVAISAGTVPGVRAAYCSSRGDAENARRWHDANLLAGSLETDPDQLVSIAASWLDAVPDERPMHVKAVKQMVAMAGT